VWTPWAGAARQILWMLIVCTASVEVVVHAAEPAEGRANVSSVGAYSQQHAEIRHDDLRYTLTSDKAVYGVNEPVALTFRITNVGNTDVKFEFATTQQYDLIIMRGTTQIARWSVGQTFPQVDLDLVLAAGKSLTYNTLWLQSDQQNQPVPPGQYEITARFLAKAHAAGITLTFRKVR
jgi:hypothetical protein